MLGKLIKYEFRATGRIYLPLFGALLIVAVISRIFMSLSFKVPTVIGITVAVTMIIAIFVITLIVTIQRFYKNLLTSEGYLMFTLPVSTDQIIWSKLLTATVWNIVGLLIVFVSILIMAITSLNFGEAFKCIHAFISGLGISDLRFTLILIEFILVVLAALVSGILTLYACMSSSLLVIKHRVLFSFGAYIVFYIIGQILSGIAVTVIAASKLPDAFMRLNLFSQIQAGFLTTLPVTLLVGVFFYFFSRFMLKNKLNLE